MTSTRTPEERREIHRLASAKWIAEHPERMRELNALWRKSHPEKKKEYRERHKEKAKIAARAYVKKNSALIKEKRSAYNKKHREHAKLIARSWAARNKDKKRLHDKKYRAANREMLNQKHRARWAANREHNRIVNAEYRRKNSEKIKAQKRAANAACPEKQKRRCREWYLRHRQLSISRADVWRKTNPETSKKIKSAWARSHPEEMRAAAHRRRALVVKAPGDCSPADWKIVTGILGTGCIHPDKSKCHGSIQQDHVRAFADGGTNHPTNRQPLCEHHNPSKGKKWIDYRTTAQVKKIMKAFQLNLDI